MHVNVYMLLCLPCYGYGYACIVGQRCNVIFIIAAYVIMIFMCWLRWGRKCRSKGELAALYIGEREDHHKSLYVGHEGMLVNGFYIPYGYMHSYHLLLLWLYILDRC